MHIDLIALCISIFILIIENDTVNVNLRSKGEYINMSVVCYTVLDDFVTSLLV